MRTTIRKHTVLLMEAHAPQPRVIEPLIRKSHLAGGLAFDYARQQALGREISPLASAEEGGTTSIFGVPMGLAYIAAGIDKSTWDIMHIPTLILAAKGELSSIELSRRMSAQPVDVLALSVNHSYDEKAALDTIAAVKFAHPLCRVILGGVHATFEAQSLAKHLEIDAIVLHEGENTLGPLLDALKNKTPLADVPGIVFRDTDGTIRHTEAAPPVQFFRLQPDYDALDAQQYFDFGIMAMIQSSRGCPYQCSFCSHPRFWGRKMRYRDPAMVAREIAWVADQGATLIYLTDSDFGASDNHAASVLRAMAATPHKPAAIVLETRIDQITKPMVQLMKRAGITIVALGVESADERVLAKTGGKGQPGFAGKVLDAVSMVAQAGMLPYTMWIMGLPGETSRTITLNEQLMRKVHDAGALWADVRLALAFPGSPISENPDKYGVTLVPGGDRYSFYEEPTMTYEDGLSAVDQKRGHRHLLQVNLDCFQKKDYIQPLWHRVENRMGTPDSPSTNTSDTGAANAT